MQHVHSIQKTRQSRNARTKRIVLILILVIIAIAASAWIYWNANKEKIIRNKIEKAIEEKSAGMYSVNYDDMQLDELAGNLSIKNMTVAYDSLKYASLADSAEKPSMLVRLFIPELSVTGVKTTKAMKGKEIVGKKLHIRDPYIQLYYTNDGKNSSKNIPTEDIYKQILGEMETIMIDTVEISNARIVTYNQKTKRDSIVFHNANLRFSGVAIDRASGSDKSRILFSDNMEFNTEKISWTARSGLYAYNIKDIVLHSGNKDINVGRIDISPQIGEVAFVNQAKYQTDRLDVHFSNIKLRDVDFKQLMNEVIIAGSLEAGSTSIKTYRDLRKPRDSKNRSGTYPHQMLARLPLKFSINNANFPGTFVEYKEVNDISGQAGTVTFNNFNISVTNLTSEPGEICRVQVNGSLMNLTPMAATLTLPVGSKTGAFSIEGNTGGVNAVLLNKLTEPMAMAKIRSGNVKSLHYKLNGDNNHAAGTVTVLYEDLKIDFLELDEDKAGGVDKKDVTSFLGNLFIKDDNPKNGEAPRVSTVDHARDMNRSFYNLVWKTIFEGINLTMGNKKKMKRP